MQSPSVQLSFPSKLQPDAINATQSLYFVKVPVDWVLADEHNFLVQGLGVDAVLVFIH